MLFLTDVHLQLSFNNFLYILVEKYMNWICKSTPHPSTISSLQATAAGRNEEHEAKKKVHGNLRILVISGYTEELNRGLDNRGNLCMR